MEYGIILKYDLVSQTISIVSGSPLYQHSVGVNVLYVDCEVANNCVLVVTFKRTDHSTTALVMTYDSVLKLWKTPIPDLVLRDDGVVTIALAVKTPVMTSGGTFYNVLNSGNVNVQVIASVAEKFTKPIPQDQASLLGERINQLDEVVAGFKSPTVDVGETTTGLESEPAVVTNSGTDIAAILNFSIPRGQTGDKGDKGDKGVSMRIWYSYNENQTYVNNEDFIDLVVYGGTTYAAKKDVVGVVPIEGEFWSVVALKGANGKDFNISMVFASEAEMNAALADYAIGTFILINTGDVEDEDTGKLFVRGQTAWNYLTDMSGAQGIQGVSIDNVMLTSTNGLVDTYTIYYSNNTTSNYSVRNGADGSTIYSGLVTKENGNYLVANITNAKVGDFVIGVGGQYEGIFGQISSIGASSSVLANVVNLRGSRWFSAVVSQINGKYETGNINGAIVGDFVISSAGQWFEISGISANTELTFKGDLNGANVYVRYSSFADGTEFTENWVEGQKYVGTATGLTAPTDKTQFVWSLFVGIDGTNGTNGIDGIDGKNGVDGKDGANGADGADGTNGKTIYQSVISFLDGNYTVQNIIGAVVGDYVMGLTGAYKGFYGIIANVGASVSTLGNVINLNGVDGVGAGNVIAMNANITEGEKYVYQAITKDSNGNLTGEFKTLSEVGILTADNIVNVRSTDANKTYSSKYIEDSFAPKALFENLFLNKDTENTASLTTVKPTVAVTKFLTTTTTNTAMNFSGSPEITINRILTSKIQFDSTDGMTIVLNTAYSRSDKVEYGAYAEINGNKISSNQAFGLSAVSGDVNYTNVFEKKCEIIFDKLTSPTTFEENDVLKIVLFKRQETVTALTSRTFCGVEVNGSNRFSYVEYNFTALSLGTNQIADGAITLPKIDPNAIDVLPTSGSAKLTTSGGVYSGLAGKQNNLMFDSNPTANSPNVVRSGGIYSALSSKQNALIFDNTPTQGSGNVITSGGVFASVATKADKTAVDSSLLLKADKTELNTVVANVATNATSIASLQSSKADKSELPTKTSQLTNDSGFDTVTRVNAELATKASKSTSVTATLLASGWANGSQAVAVSGVSATNNIEVGLSQSATLEQIEEAGEAMLMAISQSVNSITVKAFGTVPTINLPIVVVILG